MYPYYCKFSAIESSLNSVLLSIFQDDLYEIKFKETGPTIPTIFSLYNAISIALQEILSSLKQNYSEKNGQHHILYLCIADDRINVRKL